MRRLFSKSILILTTGCLLNGCSQGPLPLEVTLHQDYVCAFTNNPKKTNYSFDNKFLIFMGKVDYQNGFKSSYEKEYLNAPLPIEEKDCVKIPLKAFEKNVAYDITLDIYKTFDTRICIVENNNKLEIREPEPGETTCK
ncbi:NF045616 family extracytoplasmic (lipo)protein [Acinetobacter sp. 22301]|uniref:NF045616 family extracytoplasmic (lipo)protein n=1 Tax=Acinetobacter sp. 22301 TaxID=3453904 RepID=UPI003F85790B